MHLEVYAGQLLRDYRRQRSENLLSPHFIRRSGTDYRSRFREAGRQDVRVKAGPLTFDEYTVLDTVIQGNPRLYAIMKEKDAIYMKERTFPMKTESARRSWKRSLPDGRLGGGIRCEPPDSGPGPF